MRKVKLTRQLQQRFLEALADTGSVSTAASVAGTSRTRVYELRKVNPSFASGWQEAEEIAADQLEDEARRRALEGVPELLVSAGKLVRDDEGKPITVRRYSNSLLLGLIRAHRPLRRERPICFQLPALHSAADAAGAMASIAAAVAAGEITPGEAADLAKLVETCMRAIEANEFHERLQAIETKINVTSPRSGVVASIGRGRAINRD